MRLSPVLCASISACLLGGGVAEAADVHPEAAALKSSQSGVIARPQAPDWYVLTGGSGLVVSLAKTAAPAACTFVDGVVLSLFNPGATSSVG